MRSVGTEPQKRRPQPPWPAALDRRFEAVVFDWDGTAVPDRARMPRAARRWSRSCARSGSTSRSSRARTSATSMGSFAPGRPGPDGSMLCVNRGSEVFAADARRDASCSSGVRRPPRRTRRSTRPLQATVAELGRRGLEARSCSQRLNRRKIDLIPVPEWADPPKARIGELLAAVRGAAARRPG